MLTIISVMLLGIAVGYMLREKPLKRLDNVMLVMVWLLLFLLGLEAGGDERIVKWIASLGAEALAISVASVAGSSVFALLLWRLAGKKK